MDSSSAALPELPAWPSCFISHPQLKTPSIISSGHFYRQAKIKGSALMKAGYKITKAKCAFYKWLCGAGCSARRFLWLIPDFCLSPSFLPSLCSPLQENSHIHWKGRISGALCSPELNPSHSRMTTIIPGSLKGGSAWTCVTLTPFPWS